MSETKAEKRKLFKYQSVEGTDLQRKVGIAFFLMSLVPILLMLYMILFHFKPDTDQGYTIDLQLLALLALCSSIVGYWIIRKIAASISAMAKSAQDLLDGKILTAQIDVKDQSQEIRNLVKVFNGVNRNLEDQVKKLEESRALIQDLLKNIGSVINSEEKVESFFDLIIGSMIKALEAESGALILLAEEDKEKFFYHVAACGKEREKILSLASRRSPSIMWMSQEKRPLVINRTAESGGAAPEQDELTYRSLMCVPLRFQNKNLGCILVLNKRNEQPFTSEDTLLLEHVANQIAIAAENSRLMADAERSYVETIAALAVAVEERDPYTRGHLDRVANYAVRVGQAMCMSEKDVQTLKDGAFLHDVGKIAIEDRILLKPDKFTPEERKIMESHPEKGEKIIAPLHSFKDLREIVRHHQEWYDGSGYPDGAKGDQISLGARILTVVDVYDALTTTRPYRQALPREEALKIMSKESGTHFDPQVLKIFSEIIQQERP
jgi:HD-GYP domain-containing protein (c-di-GMP phosphodiesterase class II)